MRRKARVRPRAALSSSGALDQGASADSPTDEPSSSGSSGDHSTRFVHSSTPARAFAVVDRDFSPSSAGPVDDLIAEPDDRTRHGQESFDRLGGHDGPTRPPLPSWPSRARPAPRSAVLPSFGLSAKLLLGSASATGRRLRLPSPVFLICTRESEDLPGRTVTQRVRSIDGSRPRARCSSGRRDCRASTASSRAWLDRVPWHRRRRRSPDRR